MNITVSLHCLALYNYALYLSVDLQTYAVIYIYIYTMTFLFSSTKDLGQSLSMILIPSSS